MQLTKRVDQGSQTLSCSLR